MLLKLIYFKISIKKNLKKGKKIEREINRQSTEEMKDV